MKRMLVIAGAFVPVNDTVTLLTYKRLKHLDCEFDVLLLTGKADASLEEELKRDPDYMKFHFYPAADYDSTISIAKPWRLPLSLLNLEKYKKAALKLAQKNHYDYLYTSSVPGISHSAGLLVKKHFPEIKWFASFSDPIKNSPYKNDPYLMNRNPLYRLMFSVGSELYMGERYENDGIQADKLIFICEEERDYIAAQHEDPEELKRKSVILPLVYEKDWSMYRQMVDAKRLEHTPKRAVHLGRLYGLRRIDTFIEALRELKLEDPNLKDRIVFDQYSEIQKEDIEKIRKYGLEDVFRIHPKVNYQEAIEIMKDADILLLFDTIMDGAPVQPYLPSKILEYLLLRKPILGICQANSPSYRILNKYGHHAAYTPAEIREAVNVIMQDPPEYDYPLEDLESVNHLLDLG